jgi:hypothetical protein
MKELSNLYSLPNDIQVIKSSRMRWVGHVTGMEGKINEHIPLLGNLKVRAYLFGTPDHRLEDDINDQYEV